MELTGPSRSTRLQCLLSLKRDRRLHPSKQHPTVVFSGTGPAHGTEAEPIKTMTTSRIDCDNDVRGRYTELLSWMSPPDLDILHRVLLTQTKPSSVSMLPESVQKDLQGLTNAIDPTRTGSWFLHVTSCLMTALGGLSKQYRHPQWQFSVAGIRGDGVLQELEKEMSTEALEKLKASPNKPRTHRPQARFYLHEIAYAADCRASRGNPHKIPNNKTTRGGGISHLCDQLGCMKQEHLEAAWSHRDQHCTTGMSGDAVDCPSTAEGHLG